MESGVAQDHMVYISQYCTHDATVLYAWCHSMVQTCGQENSLEMKLAEPSVLIMNFADW